MKDNVIATKSFQFAIRIVNLYKYLTNQKSEFILSKQLLRCGTSIGANIAEAEKAQSKADFIAKIGIALKEASETDYWLRLLHQTEYINNAEFSSLQSDIDELIRILSSIRKTTQADN